MFIGMQIIVTGDQEEVKTVINALESFSPFKRLKKTYWTKKTSETFGDIIGMPTDMANLYLDSTVMNLNDKSVNGINRNQYFEKIAKKLNKLKPGKLTPFLKERFSFLDEKKKQFSELFRVDKGSENELRKIAKNMDTHMVKAIESYYIWNHPRNVHKIRKISEKIKFNILARDLI